jgi:hypothetical protein
MAAVRSHGAFPSLALPDLEATPREVAQAWREGDGLVVIGHKNCKTTRQTLPYVDRIWRRRAAAHGVVAILQDEPAVARELKRSLRLELPLLLEPDPYPLARALQLVTVPTLFLVDRKGEIQGISEGFARAELEAFAGRLGVAAPLFTPDDKAPAMTPG